MEQFSYMLINSSNQIATISNFHNRSKRPQSLSVEGGPLSFLAWIVSSNLHHASVNGSWSQWSSWQPCNMTCGGGNRTRTRTCSNPAPKWNGKDCPGTNISTESCNLHKCEGKSKKTQNVNSLYTFLSFHVMDCFF